MYPPAPAFKGPLRLAQLSDVPRIGVVAAAGFYHSPWFAYERPYSSQYPLDTLASYRKSVRSAILDPDSVVLVVEDTLNETEAASVYAALSAVYPSFEQHIPKHLLDQNKAVVAVAGFSLVPNSNRRGQFQPHGDDAEAPDDFVSNRDKNNTASIIIEEVLHPQEVETFNDRMVIDMMVTHPAYWRRGHATLATEWFIHLARHDQIGLGVTGAPMGKALFSHLGFAEAKTVEFRGIMTILVLSLRGLDSGMSR
ncbi:hypothetical protein BKA56DRAFT_669689 [Ilyonectria sp. MPI-CAGE-AT-0026]|nr:hypothetical protein BKA56DRAFT_669689 [Ilyonectria sp. MPI-CAGE-AT-0026]